MKKIFTGNSDYRKSAFLNWRTVKNEDIQNILVLAEGFLSSSIELSRYCLINNDDKKADILIFPILTNANHGIELYLKSLIWTLNKLLKLDDKIEGNHNIQQMFQTVQSKIKKYKDKDYLVFFNKKNVNLIDYIVELFKLIENDGKKNNLDFSRYPIKNDYENHFYIDSLDNVEIDLQNFLERFSDIKKTLEEQASYYFYQELKGEW